MSTAEPQTPPAVIATTPAPTPVAEALRAVLGTRVAKILIIVFVALEALNLAVFPAVRATLQSKTRQVGDDARIRNDYFTQAERLARAKVNKTAAEAQLANIKANITGKAEHYQYLIERADGIMQCIGNYELGDKPADRAFDDGMAIMGTGLLANRPRQYQLFIEHRRLCVPENDVPNRSVRPTR